MENNFPSVFKSKKAANRQQLRLLYSRGFGCRIRLGEKVCIPLMQNRPNLIYSNKTFSVWASQVSEQLNSNVCYYINSEKSNAKRNNLSSKVWHFISLNAEYSPITCTYNTQILASNIHLYSFCILSFVILVAPTFFLIYVFLNSVRLSDSPSSDQVQRPRQWWCVLLLPDPDTLLLLWLLLPWFDPDALFQLDAFCITHLLLFWMVSHGYPKDLHFLKAFYTHIEVLLLLQWMISPWYLPNTSPLYLPKPTSGFLSSCDVFCIKLFWIVVLFNTHTEKSWGIQTFGQTARTETCNHPALPSIWLSWSR